MTKKQKALYAHIATYLQEHEEVGFRDFIPVLGAIYEDFAGDNLAAGLHAGMGIAGMIASQLFQEAKKDG